MLNRVIWNEQGLPSQTTLAKVIYDLRYDDQGEDLLLDSVTKEDIYYGVELLDVALDALDVEYSKMERKMAILQNVMNRSSTALQVTNVQITAPFKRQGTVQIAVIFELSDLQTVTIFFHNPDADPKRLAPTDTLLSWKWLLNKKDVTIVVAPEKGKDLNVREVARRVMKLAEKNSAAFAKANERKAEKAKQISEMQTGNSEKIKQIEALEKELADLNKEIETLRPQVQTAKDNLVQAQQEAEQKAQQAKQASTTGDTSTGTNMGTNTPELGESDPLYTENILAKTDGGSYQERTNLYKQKLNRILEWVKTLKDSNTNLKNIEFELQDAYRLEGRIYGRSAMGYEYQNFYKEFNQIAHKLYDDLNNLIASISLTEQQKDKTIQMELDYAGRFRLLDDIKYYQKTKKQATRLISQFINAISKDFEEVKQWQKEAQSPTPQQTTKNWMDDHITVMGAGSEAVKKAIEKKLGVEEPKVEPTLEPTQEPTPSPMPEPEPQKTGPTVDVDRQKDIDYLNSILDKTLPTLIEMTTGDKLEELYNKWEKDSEMVDLINKAIEAWGIAVYAHTNKQAA